MHELTEQIQKEIRKVIIGKDDVIRKVLMAVLAQGHVLLEDVPGVGKTTLAMAFARTLGLDSRRVQFTSDTLPSDIIGFSVYDKETQMLSYKPGAVMTNLLLADEINRTSSRTQSALLEVMEEGQVTVDGVTRNIQEPFFVIATQNPLGSAGTQMLPESQMDRFMVLLSMGYPTIKEEMILMSQRKVSDPLDDVNEVISKEELLSMQKEVNEIKVSSLIYQYIAMLSDATRRHDMIQLGVSPRGSLALCRMAKASAFLAGRDYVVPEDVQDVVKDVFRHRLVLKSRARLSRKDVDKIMDEICATVHVPDRRAAGGRR